MADADTTTTSDTPTTRDATERAIFSELLLRNLTWDGPRVGPDGKLQKGTGGNMKPGSRRTVWDAWTDEHGKTTGLYIAVTEKGAKSFGIMRRVKGEPRPVKITLGRFDQGDLTLAEARAKAQALKKDMRAGINPVQVRREEKAERERQAAAARVAKLKETTHKIRAVFEAYCKAKLDKMKSGSHPRGFLEREILPRFGEIAITDLTRKQVSGMLHEIIADPEKRRTGEVSYSAIHTLNALKGLYSWAIGSDRFEGLEHSPCDHIKARGIINPEGVALDRDRILEDGEVRLFWRATGELPYPWAPCLRLLFLSASRLREIAHAHRSEFCTTTVTDEKTRAEVEVDTLTIPAKRMKGKRDHAIPLVPAMQAIIDGLPKFAGGGEYLFSMTGGERPITSMGRMKELVDAAMVRLLRQDLQVPVEDADLRAYLGLADGDAIPTAYCVTPWRMHDLRRTARSLMSRAGVNADHAERCLAHRIGGVRGVYDRFEYLLEKRDALTALAALVERIANPADNVRELRRLRA